SAEAGSRRAAPPGVRENIFRRKISHQIEDATTVFADLRPFSALASLFFASASVIFHFQRLHAECISRQFCRSYCEPPRKRGTSSSTTADIASGYGTVLSTSCPHNAQASSSASTRARTCRRR